MTSHVLNPEAISRITEWGGPEMLRELVEIFLEETPARLQLVQRAVEEHDLRLAADTVHAMRSSAGNLGCTELEALVTKIEHQARLGRLDDLPRMLQQLQEAVGQATSALQAIRQADL